MTAGDEQIDTSWNAQPMDDEQIQDQLRKVFQLDEPSNDPVRAAFSDLRSAIELCKVADGQKKVALEKVKALVAQNRVEREEGKEDSFLAEGVRVYKTTPSKWVQSTKAKEKISELTADLKKAGEITEVVSEQWNTRVV